MIFGENVNRGETVGMDEGFICSQAVITALFSALRLNPTTYYEQAPFKDNIPSHIFLIYID